MPRKVWRKRAFSSPMVRGIQRHERFQNACGRRLRTVGDVRADKRVSTVLTSELSRLFAEMPSGAPVYVFKEVVVNRVRKQSRRADLVFYVPSCAIVYVEYKTVEGGSRSSHELQLKETLSNLLKNLACRLSFVNGALKTGVPILVSALLVTRRFDAVGGADTLCRYSETSPEGVCDTKNPDDMTAILGHMGRRVTSKKGRA